MINISTDNIVFGGAVARVRASARVCVCVAALQKYLTQTQSRDASSQSITIRLVRMWPEL